MEQYVSYHKIIQNLKYYQQSQVGIGLNSFGHGNIYEFSMNNSGATTVYPLMFVTPQNVSYGMNTTTYNVQILFADRINDDLSNEIDVVSDMSIQAKRFLSFIQRGMNQDPPLFDIMDNEMPVTAIPFLERFNDYVGGVSLDINITIFEYVDACDYYPEGQLLYENGNPVTGENCDIISYSSPSCPNETIGQLPVFSGDYSNGWVIFNNSGNTITYRINVNDLKGNSGTSGTSGSSGSSGTSGSSGSSGTSGTSGSSGSSGTSGSSGSSGTNGATGSSGSSGTSGSSGSSGTSGSSGSSGTSGTSGSSGSSGTSGVSGASNALFDYQAKTTITTGDPGNGHIIWDNASQTGATSISVSEIKQSGDNIDVFLSYIPSGSTITIQDKANHTLYQQYIVGQSTDNSTYWTYPITLVSGTTQFSNNQDVLFIIVDKPSGTSGTSGTSGSSGSSGTSGSSGSSGTSGSSGSSGTSGSSGSSGSSGTSGSSGSSGTSGLGFTWRGTFNPSNFPYYINDVVEYNGSSYIAIVDMPTYTFFENPPNPAFWNLVAQSGTSGTSGSSGSSGTSGSSGSSGTSGVGSAVDVYSGGTLVVSQATQLNFSGATITSGGTGVANITITGGGGGSSSASFGVSLNGAGGQIATGVVGYLTIPYNATITGWQLVGTPSGNLIVDVWKDTYANFPPTSGDTITGSEIPTLSSSTKNQDLSLSTWNTTINSGDIIAFNVSSASTITQATLTIFITKS